MGKPGRRRHPDVLTPREWEVLALLREGLSNDQMAQRLGISFDGAKYHVSEIITKLGVRDRHEAAQWRPDAGGASRQGLFAPLFALRRVHLSSPATPVGAGIIAVAVIAVGALAWGVMATRRDDLPRWSYAEASSGSPSVMLFDLAKRHATRIPVSDDVRLARWLKPGSKFVAHGTAVDDYPIFGLDGKKVLTPFTQGKLTSEVVPAPDGSALLVGRTDNQYVVSALPDGGGTTFLASARDLAFSRDGQHAAWTGVGGGDKENVSHDWRTIYVSAKSSVSGYLGGGMAIQSQREADGAIDLAQDPWSPDNKYLLVERWPPCPADATCQGPPTFEVYGTSESFKLVWKQYAGDLLSAQWAGPGRLLVAFRTNLTGDPKYPGASTLIVDFAGGKTPLPDLLAQSCCITFGPDGNYALARVGNGNADKQRCGLYDVQTWTEIAGFNATAADYNRGFCSFANWTPDGTMVIVSEGGGN